MMPPKTHLDLFSGIGGFALAARWAGYTTVGFCEIDPFCRRVLAKNFPGMPQHDDARTLTAEIVRGWHEASAEDPASADADCDLQQQERNTGESVAIGVPLGDDPSGCGRPRTLDLLTAGYPCQPFSHAGRRMGQADDRHLWPEVRRLLGALRPRWALLENVAGHVTLGLDNVLADLESLGYAWGAVVVPACAVNAPHRRDRVWVVAHADDGRNRSECGFVQHQRSSNNQLGLGLWDEPGRCGSDAADADLAGRNGRQPERHAAEPVGTPVPPWPNPDGRGDALAHAPGGGLRRGGAPGHPGLAALGGEADANAGPSGPPFAGRHSGAPGSAIVANGAQWEAECGLGRGPDGLPRELDVAGFVRSLDRPERAWGPGWESGIPRTVAGAQPDRVSRLKALGNAIVPQAAYEIVRAMDAPDGFAREDHE